MTFETFDQSDEKTWPDQRKDNDMTKKKIKTKTNTFRELHQRAILKTCDRWDIWSDLWGDLNWPKKDNDKYKDKDSGNDKLLTCDIWDTDHNYDNWEPKFIIIFVTWQLRVTLDSVRNSCDVYYYYGAPIPQPSHLLHEQPPIRVKFIPNAQSTSEKNKTTRKKNLKKKMK